MPAPHFAVRIGDQNENQEILDFLSSIRHLVWPNAKLPVLSITITHLTMGTSNRVFKCSVLENNCDDVLLRVYGESASLLVDRDHELAMISRLSDSNVGAHLYASFENGYVLEYLQGTLLQPLDLSSPLYYKLIAAKIAGLHRLQQPQTERTQGKRGVWAKMHKWLDMAYKHTTDQTKEHLVLVSKEIVEVETFLEQEYGRSTLVFCHNDLNHANILYNESHIPPIITFLDLEYTDYDYRGFDLGNHFCEWSGLELNFAFYPTEEQRRDFLQYVTLLRDSVINAVRYYLLHLNGVPPTDVELSNLLIECERFAQVSHLLWHVWSLVLADSPNKATNFDYSLYGGKRWAEYLRRKVQLRDVLKMGT